MATILLASVMDLDSEAGGVRPRALGSVTTATKRRALLRASSKAMSYLRARYSDTIYAIIEDPTAEFVPATGSTGTGVMAAAFTAPNVVSRAYGIIVEVLTTGAIGVATARVSTDSGQTYSASFTIPDGDLALSIGVTLTFSDAGGGGFFDGDVYRVPVGYGAVTTETLAIASYDLMGGRGWDPEAPGGDPVRNRYKDAIRWFEGVRDNQIDPGLGDNTTTEEGGFFFYPDQAGEGDRGWNQAMGRTPVTASQAGQFWDEV